MFTVSVIIIIITFQRINMVIKSCSMLAIMQFIFLFSEADINLSLNTERPRCITCIVVFFETTTLIYPKMRKSLYYGRLLTAGKNSRTLITTNCIKEKMQVCNSILLSITIFILFSCCLLILNC